MQRGLILFVSLLGCIRGASVAADAAPPVNSSQQLEPRASAADHLQVIRRLSVQASFRAAPAQFIAREAAAVTAASTNNLKPAQAISAARGGPTKPGRRKTLRSSKMFAASTTYGVPYDSNPATVRTPTAKQLATLHKPTIEADSAVFAAINQIKADAAVTQQQIDSSTSSLSTRGLSLAAICSADPAFVPAEQSQTTCRVFVNQGDRLVPCTAWFVSPTHMVTAGHCIAEAGRYKIDSNDPGFVCCGFNTKGDCLAERTFNIVRWVATDGFWTDRSTANDGAVLKVKALRTNSMVPQPQTLGPVYPAKIADHVAYLDGYPDNVQSDAGCGSINPQLRYETSGKVSPLNADAGADGAPIQIPVSGCQGQSGGRVLTGGPTGGAYGIQTHGSTWCGGGRGVTGVTQITSTPQKNGVCVECLMTAIP